LLYLGIEGDDFRTTHGGKDLAAIDAELERIHGRKINRLNCREYREALARARSLLTGHWPCVAHIAERLRTHTTVNGCLVRAVLENFEARKANDANARGN